MQRDTIIYAAAVCIMSGMVSAAYGQQPAAEAAAPNATASPAPAADTTSAVVEADLAAAPMEVWNVFATPEGFKKLGVAQVTIDLRPGGKIKSHYDPKGVLGDEGTIENEIITYDPGHAFAFHISKPPKGFPFMQAYKSVWSVATMTPTAGGGTRLRLAMHGYTNDEESQKMRAFFQQGNQWVMDKLKKNLESPNAAAAPKPSTDSAAAQSPSDLAPIVVEQAVNAMPRELWDLWTTRAGMSRIVGDAKIELRPGGPYELYFSKDAAQGQRGSEGCTVLSYEPGTMLSFTWNAPPTMPYARERRTWVVLRIDPNGPHGSKMILKHYGFTEQAEADSAHTQEWKDVRAYFAQAWPRLMGAVKDAVEKR